METGVKLINDLFLSWGLSESWAVFFSQMISLLLITLVAFALESVIKKIILNISKKFRNNIPEYSFVYNILSPRIIKSVCQLVTPFILLSAIPFLFSLELGIVTFFLRLCKVYIIAVIIRLIMALMAAVFDQYSRKEEFKDRPLKGLLQTGQTVVFVIGVIIIISTFIGEKPGYLLTGLGASAAVLMLVFQDSILGVVSGIQLSANNMLKVGDWITVPKYDADGTVIEVTLNTVKVQNFDKTITTLPPYALIKDSFQNWRGMVDAKGRRVKRSINIDMTSVKFCTPEMLQKFKQIDLLKHYIVEKEQEILNHNASQEVNNSILINGRRQTNLGVFRSYLNHYLRTLPGVNRNEGFMCMVRQLQPTETGIPLELYFFSDTTNWVEYEALQADVFDHLLAAISTFDLRVFQSPTGQDLFNLGDKLKS